MNFQDYLKKEHACEQASAFCEGKTLKRAWAQATRPDWMIWLMRHLDYQDDQMYRLFGCWCAANTPLADGRVTWDLLTDNRSRKAILVAIDFANGEATREELDAARIAAGDAARIAAGDAARIAAGDAARIAAGDAAEFAARIAARDAARIAAGNAARIAAWDAARIAAWDAQAKELRRRVDFKKLLRLARKAGISSATR